MLIPGTDFNRNRDNLFFFTGFEYFYQTLDTGLLRAVVPTQQELQGNFSPSVVAGEGPGGSQLNSLGQSAFPNSQIPTTGSPGKSIDPSMQNLMKLYPAANFTPTVNDPYNYVKSEVFNQNNRQWMTRVDYNVSTNTKILEIAHTYSTPRIPSSSAIQCVGNRFLDGAVNGWQLSGVLQVQSGQNLAYTSNGADFNFQLAGLGGSGAATDASGDKMNNQFFLGTNAVQLNPVVTCNPGSGLKSHPFANPSCFAVPSGVGQNGPTLLPVVYGPAFFNADLGLFKNFKITESKTLQFRVQGYNFLNHPLWSFPSNENLTLKFDQTAPGSSSFVLDPTSANFGTAVHKEGHRIIEMAIKFYF